MKFTFKKEDVGPWDKGATRLKLKRKVCGQLYEVSAGLWRVGLMVVKKDINEDGNPNCEWRWVFFPARFESEAAARQWVNNPATIKAIQEKFTIHTQDEN